MDILEELKQLRRVICETQRVHFNKLRGPLQWDEQVRDAYHEAGALLHDAKTRVDDLISDIEIENASAEIHGGAIQSAVEPAHSKREVRA